MPPRKAFNSVLYSRQDGKSDCEQVTGRSEVISGTNSQRRWPEVRFEEPPLISPKPVYGDQTHTIAFDASLLKTSRHFGRVLVSPARVRRPRFIFEKWHDRGIGVLKFRDQNR